jgi:hypothetical protein
MGEKLLKEHFKTPKGGPVFPGCQVFALWLLISEHFIYASA